MDRQELIEYLVNEEVITEHQAHEMDNYSLFVEAVEYNGIINYDDDIKNWIEPYFQEHFSKSPEGLINENESEPSPKYPNDIFIP